jgi:hypothetical protein
MKLAITQAKILLDALASLGRKAPSALLMRSG